MSKTKCVRNFPHIVEKVDETNTHIISECTRCHGKFFKANTKGKVTRKVITRFPDGTRRSYTI